MISMPEVGLTEAADPDLAVSAGAAGAAGTEGVMGLMTVEVAATLVGLTTSESLLTMAALAPDGTEPALALALALELDDEDEDDEDDEDDPAVSESLSDLAALAGPTTQSPFLSTKPALQTHPLLSLFTTMLYWAGQVLHPRPPSL